MSAVSEQSVNDVRDAAPSNRACCHHCGEPCVDATFAHDERIFCCQGCLVVHDLLTEHGLDHFYSLNNSPGVRVCGETRRERWTFLDEPAVSRRILDFSDGQLNRVTFHIPAIHCVACVWLLENLFRLHPGIGRSQVNFAKREVAIEFRGAAPLEARAGAHAHEIRLSELVALLASIGYEPAFTLEELEQRKPRSAYKRQWLQIGIAGFAFGNIMLFSLPAYLGLDSFHGPVFRTLFGWLSLTLALPVLIYSAADYWKSALMSVR